MLFSGSSKRLVFYHKKNLREVSPTNFDKGEPVNSDAPITRPFKRKLFPNELQTRKFTSTILISHNDAWKLPFTANQTGKLFHQTLRQDYRLP